MDLIGEFGGILIGGLFGSPLLAVAFMFGFLAILGLVMRFTLDCWVVCLPTAVVVLVGGMAPWIPNWVYTIVLICMGMLVGMGVLKIFRRG